MERSPILKELIEAGDSSADDQEKTKKIMQDPSEQKKETVFPKAVSRPLNSFVFSVAFTPEKDPAVNWVLTV
jgi:hypothetical protein